jgi:hypothetical protein
MDPHNEPASHGMVRLMGMCHPRRARYRIAEVWKARGVHGEPGGIKFDMENHALWNDRIIVGSVEAGIIPRRERYQGRYR